ncbi:hypothetical protein [Natrinema sp. 74]|uniref:hypothetical protein n=1 Tax=Natrinema sp. 74 TaxID=3384159 RepID=UPI0038D3718A
MTSKAASILIPGMMWMIIGYLLFDIYGAGFGLVLGFGMGETFYQQYGDEGHL